MIPAPPPTATRKPTGFASPAQGYETAAIDLNTLLIHNPPATYLFRLETEEMAALGLPKGTILIVDRSQRPQLNQKAIILHEGEFLCRLLTSQDGHPIFTNGMTNIIPISNETQIIGTVTAFIVECTHAHAH
jgi:DNA polymerase V